MQTTVNTTDLLRYILPEGIFNYFALTKVEEQSGKLHFYLEEINIIPEELNTRRLESNGFHKESVIRDFPLRGKPTYLHVRRRRWLDLASKEVVSRNWKAVAKGTGYTDDLAFFFNELVELLPHYRPLS
jgi:hypothetical protein